MTDSGKKKAGKSEVELRFLEAVSKRMPENTAVLRPLGDMFTSQGYYEDGLQVDLKLSELVGSEPGVWYNLACSYSLLEQREQAYQALEHAVKIGFFDVELIGGDEDLNFLREDERFALLLEQVFQNSRKLSPE